MTNPLTCPDELREILSWMGAELDMAELRVELVPAPEPRHCGHQVRAVMERNPDWYRELLALFPRRRRRGRDPKYTDSYYNRRNVRDAITRLLDGGSRSQMAEPLLALAGEIRERYSEEAA